MSESFEISLKEYWSRFLENDWNWLFVFIMIGLYLFFTILIVLINDPLKDKVSKNRTFTTVSFRIYSAMFYGGVTTLLISVCIVFILLKFTPFFGINFCQMGVIISFTIVSLMSFLSFLKINQLVFKQDTLALNVPISKEFSNVVIQSLHGKIRNMIMFNFVLVTPYLLFFIPNRQQHLVSIVFDNTGSMVANLNFGMNALETAILETHQNARFVFTTLTQRKDFNPQVQTLNEYFDSIVNINNATKLPTHTDVHYSTVELLNALNQVEDAGGSPVYQGIWQNYLLSREFAIQNDFSSHKLIVVTDGQDNIYQWKIENPNLIWNSTNIFQQKDKFKQSPEEFYKSGIFIINLGGSDTEFMYKDIYSSAVIYDGTDQQSYFNALVDILPELYFDKILLYIITGILIVYFLSLLILKSIVK